MEFFDIPPLYKSSLKKAIKQKPLHITYLTSAVVRHNVKFRHFSTSIDFRVKRWTCPRMPIEWEFGFMFFFSVIYSWFCLTRIRLPLPSKYPFNYFKRTLNYQFSLTFKALDADV